MYMDMYSMYMRMYMRMYMTCTDMYVHGHVTQLTCNALSGDMGVEF